MKAIALTAIATALGVTGWAYSQNQLSQDADRAMTARSAPIERPANAILVRHFAAMFEIGPEAERNYQRSLARIRATPRISAVLMARYEALGEENPLERWQVVETLRELAAPETLAFLTRVATAPVRLERGIEEGGRTENEVIIRATATDAITAIARKRNVAAERTLLALVRNPQVTIRRRAVRGYLELGGDIDARRKRLMALLPRSDYDLIATAPTDLRRVEAPQVSLRITRKTDSDRSPAPRVRRPQ